MVRRGRGGEWLAVVAVNRVGFEAKTHRGRQEGIRFWGGSFVAGPQGSWPVAFGRGGAAVVEVDRERSEQVRRWWPFLRDRRIDAYGDLIGDFAIR